jgi:hypothetical protein
MQDHRRDTQNQRVFSNRKPTDNVTNSVALYEDQNVDHSITTTVVNT